jgi:protein disulfide-isomerase
MKRLLTLLAITLLALPALADDLKWTTDLSAAKAQAKKDGKLVFIDFTGSDWCGWCIKLDKEVFGTKQFAEYAAKNLVLVKLDFPRKVQQSDTLKKANAALKDQFNIEGFPTLIVVNGDGKELWRQVGYMEGGPKAWTEKLAALK